MEIQHTHTDRNGHFFAGPEDAPTANLVYRRAGAHKIVIDHTEVKPELRGQGMGRQLVDAAVSYARANGIKILPLCKFAKSVLAKNPGYQDVVTD